jgi:hypothetical protein
MSDHLGWNWEGRDIEQCEDKEGYRRSGRILSLLL